MSRRKPKTAAEFLAEMEHDEQYQRQRAEKEARLELLRQQYRKEQEVLLGDLRKIGFDLESVWDLVNTREAYAKAIPILVAHLDKSYSDRTTEGIVRALAIRPARGKAGTKLLEMFRKEKDENLRWVIGNTLSVVALPEETDSVLELLRDTRFGMSRGMLAHAAARLQGADAIPLLISLLEDKDVATDAMIALGKLKATEARPKVEAFLSHPDSWVRQKAKSAMKKIDKAQH
jgi:hypothetical protein